MTMPLLEGGRGFAVSTEPKDGLFNLGEAEGQAEFAAFVSSLRLARKRAAYHFHSLLPELEGFQQKVNAAFQPPRSIDLHVQFMMINSALKQATSLTQRNRTPGRSISICWQWDTTECSMLLHRIPPSRPR